MHATQKPAATLATASLAQPLRDAADYLERHGWCQGHYYSTGTDTPPADIIGALAIACYGYPTTEPESDDPDVDGEMEARLTFAMAIVVLADFIGIEEMTDANGNPVEYGLTDWNDEDYQSIGCVTAVLRAAADDYDRTGGAA
jgi:hypothetical protein